MNKIRFYAYSLFAFTAVIWIIFDQFSVYDTLLTPMNHWIPEVPGMYFIGMIYAQLPKWRARALYLFCIGYLVYTLVVMYFLRQFPLFFSLIPMGFVTLLMVVFYIGYRHGEQRQKPL